MHILIVTQYFWPEDFRINDVARGLRERGHSVTVLTGKPNYPRGRFFEGYGFFQGEKDSYHGIEVRRVPLLPRGSANNIQLALNYVSFAFFACLLGPLYCRGKRDAILVFEPSPVTVGLPARLLRALRGTPILFWVQDLWPESIEATGAIRSRAVIGCIRKLTRFIYRGCDQILVQSRTFIDPIVHLGVAPTRIRYLPNSAESIYQPVALSADAPEHANLPSGFRVMFAGNIGVAQDFENILGAAERLREHGNIHWIVLGDGRAAPWVREQVRLRGLTDTFHLPGRFPTAAMPRFFAAADAMLVTLKREPIFALTIPSKVQAYLASGRPIIAALDGEGARIVKESAAGIVVAPEDPVALAEAVRTLAAMSSDERAELGAAARRYFEAHFDQERLLEQLEGWIIEAVESQTAKAV